MKTKEFIELVIKYLNNSTNSIELEKLNGYLADTRYDVLFKEYIESNFVIDHAYKIFNTAEAKKKIIDQIREAKRKEKDYKVVRMPARTILKYAVAAVVIFVCSITFYHYNFQKDEYETPVGMVEVLVPPGGNKAILTLGDGSEVVLEKGQNFTNNSVSSDGKNLVYNEKNGGIANSAEYNYLTIPRGGQYFVQLADGSKVWLNSESRLKYPVNFVAGDTREVELVYGEAYFDVSPSTNHQGSKFRVIGPGQDIEVLGTQFNVKAYSNENTTYTALVKGLVVVNNGEEQQQLLPGQLSSVGDNKIINIQDKVNLYDITSWKEGIFSFSKTSLIDISKVLSRWYDVEFVFEDPSLKQIKFIGIFRKEQNLEQILTIIQNTKYINAYEIKDQVIILK